MYRKRKRTNQKPKKRYDYLLIWIIIEKSKVNRSEPFLEETKEVKVNAIRLQFIEEYIFQFTITH